MRNLIWILVVFLSFTTFSQSKKRELTAEEYQTLHDKARILINSNIDSSFYYANKIEKSNNILHQSFAFGIKSYLYQLKGDSIVSKKLYHKASTLLQRCPNSLDKTKHASYLLGYLGLSEMRRGSYTQALQSFEKGLQLAMKTQDYLQIIKFQYNISSLYGEVGNHKLAIREARNADLLLDTFQFKIAKEKYENNKSNIALILGISYESFYNYQPKKVYIDSATYYFKKAITYSANLDSNRIIAKSGLGNIYCYHENYTEAINAYLSLFVDAKENKGVFINAQVYYNLAISYYNIKNFDKSLLYFIKSDSINKANNADKSLYLNSNYYQAKIYEYKDNPKEALEHAKLFLENYEYNEAKKSQERNQVNVLIEEKNLEKEMILVRDKYKTKVEFQNSMFYLGVFGIPLLLILLAVNIYKKRQTEKRIKTLLLEFENKEKISDTLIDQEETIVEAKEIPKKSNVLNIDEAKEMEILEKLAKLVQKNEYLKEGFTLPYVAAKIKTNTTYLSYVVNKEFQKSFSDYVNTLKINYVIHEMIHNPTYRKYSTQAIAESVGFKNAVSFSKSFHKRTGVTPVQFIKSID